MSFMDRKIQPEGYLMPAIPITETDLYRGSGHAVAYVEGDTIVELLYLHDEENVKVIIESIANKECYIGMCSSREFCDPRLLTLEMDYVIMSIARLMRLHAEEWRTESE